MTNRTETLLRDTFASREHLADPDAARDIARSTRSQPRRWPAYALGVAAVAAAAVVATLFAGGAGQHPGPPSAGPTSASPTSTATYRGNREAALTEAQRVVRLVPLPDDAVAASLSDWPDSSFGMAPSDPDLRQVLVWSVPGDAATIGQYLRGHLLDGSPAVDGGSSSSPGGPMIPSYQYVVPSPDPDAMIDTTVIVQWLQDGDRTLVRGDTFNAARTVRDGESLVPDDVTSVEVIDPDHPGSGPRGGTPNVWLRSETDAEVIGELVRAVNALPGSIRPEQVVSCPAMIDPVPATDLRFHGPQGDLSFHVVDWCLGQVEVERDGAPLPGTLDPGDLTATVRSLLP